MGEEVEFNFRQVKQDVHIRSHRVRGERPKSKRCEQGGHIHSGGGEQAWHLAVHRLCWALRAPRYVCLMFLISLSILRVENLYVVVPCALPYTAQGAQKHMHAGLCLPVTRPQNCLTCHISFLDNRSEAGPGPWGIGPANCPALENNTRFPIQPYSPGKKGSPSVV